MSRIKNQRNKQKYLAIIVGLLVIIFVLIGVIVVKSRTDKGIIPVSQPTATSANQTITKQSSKESRLKSDASIQVSSERRNMDSISTSKQIDAQTAAQEVKKLSTEQRAALIILGAPNQWRFNGYPSQSTMNQSVSQMAKSDTNRITLMKVTKQLATNTSEDDQLFFITGNDVQGVGGVITSFYAFGRDKNRIFYYQANETLEEGANLQPAISFGKANIDEIWTTYYLNGNLDVMDRIASHIILN